MLASTSAVLPTGDRWSYEVKWDDYRTLAIKDGSRVRLYSRRLKDATTLYPAIARAAAAIPVETAILDGELIALDDSGQPSFQALHHQVATRLAYYVFDILHLDGRELVDRPLAERRRVLAGVGLQSPIFHS